MACDLLVTVCKFRYGNWVIIKQGVSLEVVGNSKQGAGLEKCGMAILPITGSHRFNLTRKRAWISRMKTWHPQTPVKLLILRFDISRHHNALCKGHAVEKAFYLKLSPVSPAMLPTP